MIETNPNFYFCPANQCELFVNIQDASENKIICQCGQLICSQCGKGFHFGKSCADAIESSFKEAIITYQIKNCPKCRSPIQKNEGCNHMSCTVCKYEFCWLCFRKYTKYHYKAYNLCGCPFSQFSNKRVKLYEALLKCLKNVCVIFFYFILCIIGFTLLLIFFPILFFYWMGNRTRGGCCSKLYELCFEPCLGDKVYLQICLGIIFYPITFVYCYVWFVFCFITLPCSIAIWGIDKVLDFICYDLTNTDYDD